MNFDFGYTHDQEEPKKPERPRFSGREDFNATPYFQAPTQLPQNGPQASSYAWGTQDPNARYHGMLGEMTRDQVVDQQSDGQLAPGTVDDVYTEPKPMAPGTDWAARLKKLYGH